MADLEFSKLTFDDGANNYIPKDPRQDKYEVGFSAATDGQVPSKNSSGGITWKTASGGGLIADPEGSATDPNPINANTLEGYSASSFNTAIATKAPLNNPIFTGDAQVQGSTNYTTAKLRNIILSTSLPDSSMGNNGDIWIVYEV